MGMRVLQVAGPPLPSGRLNEAGEVVGGDLPVVFKLPYVCKVQEEEKGQPGSADCRRRVHLQVSEERREGGRKEAQITKAGRSPD